MAKRCGKICRFDKILKELLRFVWPITDKLLRRHFLVAGNCQSPQLTSFLGYRVKCRVKVPIKTEIDRGSEIETLQFMSEKCYLAVAKLP